MRAAGYNRVSTEEQATHGFSIDEQKERILDHIQKEKWTFIGQFTDPGYSGKDLKRPGMIRLLSEIEKGNIDIVVVHKLDRITRDISDLYNLLNLFEKHKVEFVSVTEKIDTSTAMGRMFVFMLGIFAQWYRENLSEEVRKGMSGRAKKGLHNVTVPLYGYERGEKGTLVVKPAEAKWVRWIFEQYIAGLGTTNIGKRLNDMGIRRNRGAKWDQHKVMLTLTNLHYIGKIHWKAANLPEEERIIRNGTHEPIITPEVFAQSQTVLHRRQEGQMSRTSYEYIFSGIVKCGQCGGGYKGKYTKLPNGLYRSYVCAYKERYGNCSQAGISEMNLTKLLFDTIRFTTGPNALKVFAKQEDSVQHTEREEILKQLASSEARRNRWQLAFGDGNMPYQDFAKLMKEEMEKVSGWEQALLDTPETIQSRVTPEEAFDTLRDLNENWKHLEQPTRKRIIQSIFRQITVRKEDSKWSIERIILA